jgi:putative peptide zinc metalloprotease protein
VECRRPAWLQNLSLSLMIVCSVNTLLFNGNPLLRFDGYYVLADWLEIPNLRERCNTVLKRLVMKHALGMEVPPEPPMIWWRRALFVGYAIASYVYGWLITFGVIWFLSSFLKPYKLGTISMLLACLAIASMVGWPLYRLGKGIYERGRLPATQPARIAFTGGVVMLLLALFFVLPLPFSRVAQTALVQPRPTALLPIYLSVPGTLERLHVRNGQEVRPGDMLAEFRNLELEGTLEEARSQHVIRLVQLSALRQQAAETADMQERARLEVAIVQTEGERRLLADQVAIHERTLRQLVLRAPRPGVVMGLPRAEEVGKLWEKGQSQPFCSIGDPAQLRAIAPISPADYRLIKEDLGPSADLPVTIRVQGWGGRTWSGKLSHLPESEARNVPLALTTRAGGPVEVRPGSGNDELAPQSQCYLLAVDFPDHEASGVWPGVRAQVMVHCHWRTGAWWLWRTLSSAFDLGLIG